MNKVAIYGKGGSGKSMVAANLAVQYALAGKKVLQIGCDPKHDSTLSIRGGKPIPTVLSLVEKERTMDLPSELFTHECVHGISCIEAGGPEPGVGCAGRGIVMAFQLINRGNFLEKFDVVILDVLGDVVCGGFAAPLQHGIASRVAILVSDNLMSIYAANNVAKVIRRYHRNGVSLVGLIANAVRDRENIQKIESFAKKINTGLLAAIPYDEKILDAELQRTTVSDLYPESELVESFAEISRKLLKSKKDDCPVPEPMNETELETFFAIFRK